MPASLRTDALTSLSMAKVYIGQPDADEDRLALLINAYSRAITLYCEREFLASDGDLERSFVYGGAGVLPLTPYELRTVETLTLDGDELAASDYLLGPIGIDGTVLSILELPARAGTINVLGGWGMEEVPADVELALLMAVSDGFRNPEGFASRSLGELSVSEVTEDAGPYGRSLPPDARALLSPYRRVGYA